MQVSTIRRSDCDLRLGSCIGLAVYDPLARWEDFFITCFLNPPRTPRRPRATPMFADTGIPLFPGGPPPGRSERMQVKVAGGAHLLDDRGISTLESGTLALRKILGRATTPSGRKCGRAGEPHGPPGNGVRASLGEVVGGRGENYESRSGSAVETQLPFPAVIQRVLQLVEDLDIRPGGGGSDPV
jgi:hypothetical protein